MTGYRINSCDFVTLYATQVLGGASGVTKAELINQQVTQGQGKMGHTDKTCLRQCSLHPRSNLT